MPELQLVDLHLFNGEDRTCVWQTEHLQIMRVQLAVGEALPHHNANSDVLLTPVVGAIRLVCGETDVVFGPGQAMSVPFGTPMDVSNGGEEPAVMLLIKAPHPKTMG